VWFNGTNQESRPWSQHYPIIINPQQTIPSIQDFAHNYLSRVFVSEDFDLVDEVNARQAAIAELVAKISLLESLGSYVGTFDTYALVPTNISGFTQGITINDFVNVRADSSHNGDCTRYIASAINSSTGAITWTYDITLSGAGGVDITGKADKVASATNGNLAGLNASGNLTDSGSKPSDFTSVTNFNTHTSDSVMHVSASERSSWNAMVPTSSAATTIMVNYR
jgi:hypothetical protein